MKNNNFIFPPWALKDWHIKKREPTDCSHPLCEEFVSEQSAYLFVGLGNPGASYNRTRHNIGFRLVDALAHHMGCPPWRCHSEGLLTSGKVSSFKVILLKPQTFMNCSGESVQKALRFFKIPLSHLVVFHDDLDLSLATVRCKKGGGDAGHRGLESITQALTNAYERIRYGIGRPTPRYSISRYVLEPFSTEEEPWVDALAEATYENIHLWFIQRSSFAHKIHTALLQKGHTHTPALPPSTQTSDT